MPPFCTETNCEETHVLSYQDAFDHDKGQKSAISGKFLHWIFLNFRQWNFSFFAPGSLCNLVRKSLQNVEKIARFPDGAKGAESCHVSGCHVFCRSRSW